jgi:hypothetical protein
MTHHHRFLAFGLTTVLVLGISINHALGVTYAASILALPGYNGGQANGISGGTIVGVGYVPPSDNPNHYYDALLWEGPTSTPISLNPGDNWHSTLYGVSSDSQVGTASSDVFLDEHAALWHGTAASFVDLNPAGFYTSQAYAVSGNTQVGGGGLLTQNGGLGRGLVWHGTAASAVDLTPAGYAGSVATGIEGDNIVGLVGEFDNGIFNASLWTGAAHTLTNLQPAGYASSEARGVSQNSQVGTAWASAYFGTPHAMLWHSTAASAVDLNPAGFSQSDAYGVAGNLQVGAGSGTATAGNEHALLWQGTAATAFDLHSLLGPGFVTSYAYGVDSSGVVVGYAADNNRLYAVQWSPVSEPSTVALAICAGVICVVLRKRI